MEQLALLPGQGEDRDEGQDDDRHREEDRPADEASGVEHGLRHPPAITRVSTGREALELYLQTKTVWVDLS